MIHPFLNGFLTGIIAIMLVIVITYIVRWYRGLDDDDYFPTEEDDL